MKNDRALFRRWPELIDSLPHIPLADLPTPVERLDRLSEAMGAELWIKRDDRSSSLYGGNKVRKLEFLLADALASGAKRVWTIGPAGSHHVLALARFSKNLGLSCSAVTFPEYETRHTDAVRRAILASGCHVIESATWPKFVIDVLQNGPGDAYVIPAGSSNALADLGYLSAGLELADQIHAKICPQPDVVVVALGSGGTSTGLLVGLEIRNVSCRLDLVRVTSGLVANRINLHRQACDMARLLDRAWKRTSAASNDTTNAAPLPPCFGPFQDSLRRTLRRLTDLRSHTALRHVRINLVSNQMGPGYAVPTADGMQAAAILSRYEGIEMEPTYTAKAFAHVLDLIRRSQRRRPVILFWHTAHQDAQSST